MEDLVLASLDTARQALIKAKTIQETKVIMDMAIAAEIYAKRQELGEEAIRYAQEIKIEALRQLGNMLKETERQKPGEHWKKKRYQNSTVTPTLADLGLDKKTSSLAQQIADLSDEEIKKVKDGATIATLLKEHREIELKKQREELAEKSKDIELDKRIDLRHGDFREVLANIEKVDLILTDPPYPKEYLPLWKDLAKFAKEKLKENGYLIAYSGQYHLPQVINYLSDELNYIWVFCLNHKESQIINNVNVMCRWKPILIFQKGRTKFKYTISDYIEPINQEKLYHSWQQPLSPFEKFIENFTNPGDIVCDPFSGSGTVALACKNSNRLFIGAEVDSESYNIAKGRIFNEL